MSADGQQPRQVDRDERVSLPLDPETALRALLAVKPDDPPADPRQGGDQAHQTDDEAPTK